MIDLRPGCEYVFFCGRISCGKYSICKKRIVFRIKDGVPSRHLDTFTEYYFNEIEWFNTSLCCPGVVSGAWQGEFCEL